jgi:hypothetical protein
LVLFAVWEPILASDWSAPGRLALNRIDDRRVRQFWDPNHLVAAAIKRAEVSGTLHPDCCERKGFLWDLTAAYPAGAHWTDALPQPVLLNGPVVDTVSELDEIAAKAK